eukprot:TRINITY_DN17417_c0_g1_i1.p1 TRINITY_DN17417_c0_g1~~TRINITY_DN17417_c0_g1_i1.p1  ORF type:complete len:220 (-),score=33.20 TRINITY_DN17417_c0_g1_i1:23-643(-)
MRSCRKLYNNFKDAFEILQVNPAASQEEIKRQYHALCKQFHPDRQNGCSTKMKELNDAYEQIRNGYRRAHSTGENNSSFGGGFAAGWQRPDPEQQARHRRQWEQQNSYRSADPPRQDQQHRDWQQNNRAYQRQHFGEGWKKQGGSHYEEEQAYYDYFGWYSRNRRMWEECKRSSPAEEKPTVKVTEAPKSRIILGTGIADGSIKWW